MIRGLLALSLVSTGMMGAASAAHEPPYRGEVRFSALPCAAACAYWTDSVIGVSPCAAPWPPWAYADVLLRAPDGAGRLAVEVFPEVDWDLFVCDPETGRIIVMAATPIDRWGDPPHDLPGACDRLVPESWPPIGCIERATIPVTPGRTYLLRAYNWSDPLPLRGRFEFSAIGASP